MPQTPVESMGFCYRFCNVDELVRQWLKGLMGNSRQNLSPSHQTKMKITTMDIQIHFQYIRTIYYPKKASNLSLYILIKLQKIRKTSQQLKRTWFSGFRKEPCLKGVCLVIYNSTSNAYQNSSVPLTVKYNHTETSDDTLNAEFLNNHRFQ